MASNTTTVAGLLKVNYSKDEIKQQQGFSATLWKDLPTHDQPLGGSSTRYPVRVAADQSFAFVAEGGAYPSANNENVQQASLSPKTFLGMVQASGLAKSVTQGDEMAFAKVLDDALSQKIMSMTSYLDLTLFNDGNGQLALINEGSVPDTTTAVDIDNPGVDRLKVGMNIDFLDSSTNVKEATAKITEVDFANDQIKLDTNIASSIGNNSKLFLAGTQSSGSVSAREPIGLEGQVATSGTWHGLALSSYPNLKGNVINASSVDLTEDIMQRAVGQIFTRQHIVVGQPNITVISNFSQVRKYLDLVVPQKQFTGLSLDAGYSNLAFNGAKWIINPYVPRDTVWFGDLSQFYKCFTLGGELGIADDDGLVLRNLDGFDSWVILLRAYLEYFLAAPSAFCRLHSLNKPTA